MSEKKVISFSLWGSSRLYAEGAIENVRLAEEIYPDYICRFYISENCPALPILEKMKCELVIMEKMDGLDRNRPQPEWHWDKCSQSMLWRFLAIDDCGFVLFRDADSRLSWREERAVREWEKSEMLCSRIAENSAHLNSVVMGGMFGVRGQLFDLPMQTYIDNFLLNYHKLNEPYIFVDLWFIRVMLWKYIEHSCMSFGVYPNGLPLFGEGKVGDVVNEEWRNEIFTGENYGV